MATILPGLSRTLGEYLLLPTLTTEEHIPENVKLTAAVTRYRRGEVPRIQLNIPLVSAIMQSVSNDSMAIALAREGGLSFIFCSQPIDSQVDMVSRVKKFKAGFVVSDTNLSSEATIEDVIRITSATGHSKVVITEDGTLQSKFLGLVTAIDYRDNIVPPQTKVSEFMTPVEKLVCGNNSITLKEANELILRHRIEALPVLTADGRLATIVFRKDLREHRENPLEMTDNKKRLMVGAGVNTHDHEQRIPALVEAGADVLCLDSSDGFSVWQKRAIDFVRNRYGNEVKIGAGNVVDRAGFLYLAEADADFVKVGIGGGTICITRNQKGIGRGQASALLEVCAARDEYFERTGIYIPICCDGGTVSDYHVIIALAMGADFIMLGRYFARFDESPTDVITIDGIAYKEHWGEGSNRARNWQRYHTGDSSTAPKGLLFEEGVDSLVPYAGRMKDTLMVSVAALKSTMCNCGSVDLASFRRNAILTELSDLSVREGEAHDVVVRSSKKK